MVGGTSHSRFQTRKHAEYGAERGECPLNGKHGGWIPKSCMELAEMGASWAHSLIFRDE